jgi:hypothetical protein
VTQVYRAQLPPRRALRVRGHNLELTSAHPERRQRFEALDDSMSDSGRAIEDGQIEPHEPFRIEQAVNLDNTVSM